MSANGSELTQQDLLSPAERFHLSEDEQRELAAERRQQRRGGGGGAEAGGQQPERDGDQTLRERAAEQLDEQVEEDVALGDVELERTDDGIEARLSERRSDEIELERREAQREELASEQQQRQQQIDRQEVAEEFSEDVPGIDFEREDVTVEDGTATLTPDAEFRAEAALAQTAREDPTQLTPEQFRRVFAQRQQAREAVTEDLESVAGQALTQADVEFEQEGGTVRGRLEEDVQTQLEDLAEQARAERIARQLGEGVSAADVRQDRIDLDAATTEQLMDRELDAGDVAAGAAAATGAATDVADDVVGTAASVQTPDPGVALEEGPRASDLAFSGPRREIAEEIEAETGAELGRGDVAFEREGRQVTGQLTEEGELAVAEAQAPLQGTPLEGVTEAGARLDTEIEQTARANRELLPRETFNRLTPDISLEEEFNRATPDRDELLGFAAAAAPVAAAEPTPLGEIAVGTAAAAGLAAGGVAAADAALRGEPPEAQATAQATSPFADELEATDEQFRDELDPADAGFASELPVQSPTTDTPELLIGERRPGRGGNVMPDELEPTRPAQEVDEVDVPNLTASPTGQQRQRSGVGESLERMEQRIERSRRRVNIKRDQPSAIRRRQQRRERRETPTEEGGFGRTRFPGGSELMDRRQFESGDATVTLDPELSRVVEATELGGVEAGDALGAEAGGQQPPAAEATPVTESDRDLPFAEQTAPTLTDEAVDRQQEDTAVPDVTVGARERTRAAQEPAAATDITDDILGRSEAAQQPRLDIDAATDTVTDLRQRQELDQALRQRTRLTEDLRQRRANDFRRPQRNRFERLNQSVNQRFEFPTPTETGTETTDAGIAFATPTTTGRPRRPRQIDLEMDVERDTDEDEAMFSALFREELPGDPDAVVEALDSPFSAEES